MPVLRRVLALLAALLLAAPVALADPMPVTGQGHVQNLGWMAPTSQTIGTTGRALRLEALRLSGPVYVTPHVQNLGWLRPVDMLDGDGVYAGTTGRSLRLEAVKITMAPVWADSGGHVEYQCHVQDIGWMPWVRDGAVCGTTGRSLRLEAIRVRHVPPTATTPTPEPTATPTPTATATPPAEGATSIAVTADTGVDDPAGHAVMDAIGRSGAGLVSILGDLAYQPGRAADYCAMVSARVAAPVLLAPGNHEAQNGDGPYSAFVSCLPDRVGVSGDYERGQWFVDSGPVRYIGISPNIALPSGNRQYAAGSSERAWLDNVIQQGKAAGQWVIVGMHIPCLTVGIHGCERDQTLDGDLIAQGVDLVVQGHDHNYSRSHQITQLAKVVDADNAYTKGRGTVFAVVGNGGHKPREITGCPAMWAACSGTNSPGGGTTGWLRIDATGSTLTARLVTTSGPLTDAFTVTR